MFQLPSRSTPLKPRPLNIQLNKLLYTALHSMPERTAAFNLWAGRRPTEPRERFGYGSGVSTCSIRVRIP